MRVAAVDLGTVSSRLLLATIEDGAIVSSTKVTEITDLGRGVDATGRLSDDAIGRVLAACGGFVQRIADFAPDAVCTTLTSAARDAGNGEDLIGGLEQLGLRPQVIPGQIEAGSYMVAAAITGGNVLIKNVIPKHLEPITAKMELAGVIIEEYDDAMRVVRTGDLLPLKIKTMPHPGFPTDMQPLMTVLLTLARGTSIITEGIWENRFRYVDELVRMGANIQVDGQVAVIEGVPELQPAPLRASDLRAGAALDMAALAANGTSEIDEISHIERGYEDLVEKLQGLGADIRRVEKPVSVLPQAL